MIPLKAALLKYDGEWPDWIIIHHTGEMYPDVPGLMRDVPKAQITDYLNYNYKVGKQIDAKYHFILEQIGNDYQVIVAQPLITKSYFEDIPREFEHAVHIGLMGNYDIDFPTTRLYKVLCYRILIPLLRIFYLKENQIVLHRAISTDRNQTCPGEYVDMNKILTELRSMIRKKPIKRG